MWTLCKLTQPLQQFLGVGLRIISLFYSIYLKWEDKRHIEGNEGRNISCKSKHVDWTPKEQFWVPKVDVWDTMELVSRWLSVFLY